MIELEPDERNRVLLAVLYAAGLRVSEACGLRWRNLQARGDAGQILIHGKGGRTRVVFLPPGVWGQLASLKGTAGLDAPVFASRSGKPLERSRVTRIVQGGQPAGWDCRQRQHALAAARPRFTCARPGRADSSGAGHAGAQVGGDDQPVFPRPTGRVERGVPRRLVT